MTFDDIRKSILARGPVIFQAPTWDSEWRAKLVDNLEIIVKQLWAVGITEIFVDGSFVEEKDHPNDIDGYFECNARDFRRIVDKLNTLDPHRCWTWALASRRPSRGSTKAQLPMWHHYRVEMYPHYSGILSGIQDEFGNNQTFPAAFRKTRGFPPMPKGVIKVIQEQREEVKT